MRGIKNPIEAAPNGSFATLEGDNQTDSLLRVALNDCASENPFQDLGMDPPIFNINDEVTKARTSIQIKNVFDVFENEGRAKLAKDGIDFQIDSEKQGLIVFINYINIETGRKRTLTKILRGVT